MCFTLFYKRILPVPKIEKYNKFLFLASHYDDIPKAVGGTIKAFVEKGKSVKVVFSYDSSLSYEDKTLGMKKKKEALLSLAILGVKEVEFLPFDIYSQQPIDLLKKEVIKVIEDYKPDVVALDDIRTPNELYYSDAATSIAALQAIEELRGEYSDKYKNHHKIKAVAFYNTTKPNAYIGIAKTKESKLQAIIANISLPEKDEDKIGYIRAYKSLITFSALKNGLKCGKLFAEGFYVVGAKAMHNLP